LRISEAVAARLDDIHDAELTVTVKGGHRQTKPLTLDVSAAIRSAAGPRDKGPILVRDGHGLSRTYAWRLIETLAATADIDDITPHVLRHTAASLALEAGARAEDVQELLGHRSIETTLRYLEGRDKRAGARKAAQLLSLSLTTDPSPPPPASVTPSPEEDR
jgi:integrase